ncbi:hypothetical protein JW960_08415 [candidate division KSB1 bacterium]|nr:hypothetical protein [candidate division KSB1 bacterium]
MKKMAVVAIILTIIIGATDAFPIQFVTTDSIQPVYTWHSPNDFRDVILLNGIWDYRTSDDDKWNQVQVPSATLYQGEMFYRRTFTIDSSLANAEFTLVCYGLNYQGAFYINDKFIGSHSGGYSSFTLDLPQKMIKLGVENKIEIRVQGKLDPFSTIPLAHQFQSQKQYFGIFRDIYILAMPEQSIEISRLDYQLNSDYSEARIRTICTIHDRTKERIIDNQKMPRVWCRVDLYAIDMNKALVSTSAVAENETSIINTVQTEINIKRPRLWSPDLPELYLVKVVLFNGKEVVDETERWLGIKDIAFRNSDIFLNGERFVVKGVNYYETYSANDKLPSAATIRQDIDYIKELKANTVRVIGHIPHPYFVEQCDRQGLFVFEELPLFGIPLVRMQGEAFFARASDYVTEMVRRDQPRTSLFAWGIGGPYNADYSLFLNNITTLVKQLDERPVYCTNTLPFITAQVPQADIAGLDVFDMHKDDISMALPTWLQHHPGSLTMIVSFGSFMKSVAYDVSDPGIFNEMQVLNIAQAWNVLKRYQELDGYFINSLTDWESIYPRIQHGPQLDPYIVPSGLMGYTKNKRLAFSAVRSLFLEGNARVNPSSAIAVEHPGVFPFVGVALVLIFLFIYNTRKYFKENIRRIFIHPHGFYVDLRDKRKIPVSHTIIIGLVSSIGVGLTGATLFYYFKDNAISDHIFTMLALSDAMKIKLIALSWHPGWAVTIIAALHFVGLLLIGIWIKILALLFRKRWKLSQSVTMVYWCSASSMFFVLLGMVLYRVLLYTDAIVPISCIIIYFMFWFLARLIKGLRVAFFWSVTRASFAVMVFVGVITAFLVYYYQQSQGLIDYLTYYFTYWIHVI